MKSTHTLTQLLLFDLEDQSKQHKEWTTVNRLVWCTLSFVGWHKWDQAAGNQWYLKYPHRHLFQVQAGVKVSRSDREVEFISLKEKIQEYVNRKYTMRVFDSSCEMIAEDILRTFGLDVVTVSEDGENGATVTTFRNVPGCLVTS